MEKALSVLGAPTYCLPRIQSIAKLPTFTRSFGFGRSVLLLNFLVIVAIGTTAGFTIWDNHRSAREARLTNMNSMGIVLAEQTSRFVQVIDLTLREVQSRIVTLNIATPEEFQSELSTQDFQSYLAERAKNVPQADAIILIGGDGLTLNWSRGWPVVRVPAGGVIITTISRTTMIMVCSLGLSRKGVKLAS